MKIPRVAMAFAALLVVSLGTGCAPTERYTTDKTPQTTPTPPGKAIGSCGMSTGVTRLQSRASNQRSVEGFGSFPCATPTPAGAR